MCFPLVLLLVGQLEYHPGKGLDCSVLSRSIAVICRFRAVSCSIFAFCLSECIFAFWYASSSFTRSGMSLVGQPFAELALRAHGVERDQQARLQQVFGRYGGPPPLAYMPLKVGDNS